MMLNFDEILQTATEEMQATGHAYIRGEHLLLALARLPDNQRADELLANGLNYEQLAQKVHQQRRPTCAVETVGSLSASAKRAVIAAQNHKDGLNADTLLSEILQKSVIARKLVAVSAQNEENNP